MSRPIYDIVSYARTAKGVRAWNAAGNTTEFTSVGLSLNPARTTTGFTVNTAAGEVEFRCSPSLAKSAMVDLQRGFAFVPAGWVDKGVRRNKSRRGPEEILLACRAVLRLWRMDLTQTIASASAACGVDRGTVIYHMEATPEIIAALARAKKARAILEANAGVPTVEVAAREALAMNAAGEQITPACFVVAKKYGVTPDRVRNWITRNGVVPVLKVQGVASRARRQGVAV